MTREDIIRMAKEARMPYFYGTWEIANLDGLERFAALVAAHERAECAKFCRLMIEKAITDEREECAKVCEAGIVETNYLDASDWNESCENRAAAIRARGVK